MMNVLCNKCGQESFSKTVANSCTYCGGGVSLVHISTPASGVDCAYTKSQSTHPIHKIERIKRARQYATAQMAHAQLAAETEQDEYKKATILLDIDAINYAIGMFNEAEFIEENIESLIAEYTPAPLELAK